jgi:hypothetical protein
MDKQDEQYFMAIQESKDQLQSLESGKSKIHAEVQKRQDAAAAAAAAPRSPILFTLIMEAIISYESSVLTRATLRNKAEDGILYNYNYVKMLYGLY